MLSCKIPMEVADNLRHCDPPKSGGYSAGLVRLCSQLTTLQLAPSVRPGAQNTHTHRSIHREQPWQNATLKTCCSAPTESHATATHEDLHCIRSRVSGLYIYPAAGECIGRQQRCKEEGPAPGSGCTPWQTAAGWC
jgi:hypothetical protein